MAPSGSGHLDEYTTPVVLESDALVEEPHPDDCAGCPDCMGIVGYHDGV